MSAPTALTRLQAAVASRRRLVLGVWLAVLVAAVPFALRQEEGLTGGGFAVTGSDSAQVERQLQQGVPAEQRGVVLGAVLIRDRSTASVEPALRDLRRAVARTDRVSLPPESLDVARYQARKRPGRPVVVSLVTSADEYRVPDVARDLRERLELADGYHRGGVRMHLVGQGALWAGLIDLTKTDLRAAEVAGFPVVALILLAVFGSLAAALLPLTVAAIAVAVTGALILALSSVTTMNVYVTNMAAMIGIGVAVDYSLFVVVRYREELADGASRARARERAMATSGVAVLFSGLTVAAALASLLVVQTAVLRSMALAAIVIVLVSVALTLTLVPALLAVLGRRISPRSAAASARTVRRWERWTRRVMSRPRLALGVSTLVLLALAAPAAGLKLGDGALRQFPADNETRQGFEAAASVTAPGRGSPIKLLAPPDQVRPALATLIADPEVKRAGSRGRTSDRRRVVIMAEARHDGDSRQTKELVERMRTQLGQGVLVGGNSAAQLDFDQEVLGSLWLVALLTALACFAILAALLRSVVLPLKAIATNLLSVAAAFGVLTVVFVWGAFDGLLGWQSPGYVDTFTVPLIVAAVFGLSMDYQVFLLSRIRERFQATGDTERSVSEALVASARTITGAAAVMVAVFAVFVATGVPVIQQVGLGCAVAIALDATLVRLVLVPAAMVLLGRWNWWWPGRRARTRMAAAAAVLALVALVAGCGNTEDEEPPAPRPQPPTASTTVASAQVRVTPDQAGTPQHPQPVRLALSVTFRSPERVEAPLLESASVQLPRGTRLDGSARPACARAVAARDPAACPRGSITGEGSLDARADTSPAKGTVTVINGGQGRVWLHTVLRNPVRSESLVTGTVTRLAGGRSRLLLRFPEDLQMVGGVPVAVRKLQLEAGAGSWLTTTACPAGGRWPYRGRAVFADGSAAGYADEVRCRPGR